MSAERLPSSSGSAPRTVAVIDIGSSAVRMEIAELQSDGSIRSLEALQHPVHLGKDTFTTGKLSAETIEECVLVLKGYRRVLRDYGIDREDQIRAVATSSVREATNREMLLNRIMVVAHLQVEVLEEAEVNRLTYVAVRESLEKLGSLDEHETLIVEVGAGSTEVLLVQKGHVTLSRAYRLGALRMREMLEVSRTPASRVGSMLTKQIQRTIDQIQRTIPPEPVQRMIAIGGDVRFAVNELMEPDDEQRLISVPIKQFAQFAKGLVSCSVDEAVRRYRIPYQEAETAGPALLAYARLAESFQVRELLMSRITLRDGLLQEMALRGAGAARFQEQVVYSALRLGHKYGFEEKHAQHVTELAVKLFQALQDEHELEPRHELILRVAGLLHEIGGYVASQSHHKHSQYLIMNSDLFGLSRRDTQLAALVARYHRRATPKSTHPEYMSLPTQDKLVVSKLAALLRVADALDQNHMQQVRRLKIGYEPGRLVLHVRGVEDLTLERLAIRQKGNLFSEIFGMQIELRRDTAQRGARNAG